MTERCGGFTMLDPIFVIVISWLLIAGLLFLYYAGRSLFRAVGSRRWPTTNGTITCSKVKHPKGPGGHFPDVRFEYRVRGRTFISKTYAFHGGMYMTEAIPRGICSRYLLGTGVNVHYHPRKHSVAVIETGFGPGLFAVLVAFSALGLLLVCLAGLAIYRPSIFFHH